MKDIWTYFDEWEGWTCKRCGELIESNSKTLMRHLEDEHKIEVIL